MPRPAALVAPATTGPWLRHVAGTARRQAPEANPCAGGLRFALPLESDARVAVFDGQDRPVRVLHEGALAAGEHCFSWDGLDDRRTAAPAGNYSLRLLLGGRVVTSRCVSLG
jgi:hypothetical protein